MKDLIDSVEENVKSLEKKTLYRKRPISKANWKITKRRKAHESGQEYTNHKGKLIAAKTIKVKKDCMNSCKFNCAQHIEKESQEMIFTEFYKLDTNGKHSFIAQTSVCSSVSGNKESRKKSSYSYFLMKGEKSFRVCKSFYLSTLAVSQKMVYNVYQSSIVNEVIKTILFFTRKFYKRKKYKKTHINKQK